MTQLDIQPETLKALEEARKPLLSEEELKKIEEESGLRIEKEVCPNCWCNKEFCICEYEGENGDDYDNRF